MIEIKAEADMGKGGTSISCHIEGTNEEIVHETLGIIEGLLKDVRDGSEFAYVLILHTLADHPEILQGGKEHDEHEQFAKMMAEMTDKSVIGKENLN